MRCDNCGQALPEIRLGVRLTPFKARLFDLVKGGGINGIHSDDLYSLLYPEGGGSRHTLKSHVWQINELIADEGYRIEGAMVCSIGSSTSRKRAISKLQSIPLIGTTSKHASFSACGPKYERR